MLNSFFENESRFTELVSNNEENSQTYVSDALFLFVCNSVHIMIHLQCYVRREAMLIISHKYIINTIYSKSLSLLFPKTSHYICTAFITVNNLISRKLPNDL